MAIKNEVCPSFERTIDEKLIKIMQKILCVILMTILASLGSLWAAGEEQNIPLLALKMVESDQVNDPVNKNYDTALHLAVREGLPDTVRMLLDQNADPTIREGRNHETPLHIAARLGKLEALEILLPFISNEAILNEVLKKILVSMQINEDMRTAVVKRLYSAGARPVSTFSSVYLRMNAMPDFLVAIKNDYNPELLQYLLDWYLDYEQNNGADFNVAKYLADLIPLLIQSQKYPRLLRLLNALWGHALLGKKYCVPTMDEIYKDMDITARELSSLELALRLLSKFLSNKKLGPENENLKLAFDQVNDHLIAILSNEELMAVIGDWNIDVSDLSAEIIEQALLLAKKPIKASSFEGDEAMAAKIVLIAKVLETHIRAWRASQMKSSRSVRLSQEDADPGYTEYPEHTENKTKEQEEAWFPETEEPMDHNVLLGVEISSGDLLENLMRQGMRYDYDRQGPVS